MQELVHVLPIGLRLFDRAAAVGLWGELVSFALIL